jgi:hypothetical protein
MYLYFFPTRLELELELELEVAPDMETARQLYPKQATVEGQEFCTMLWNCRRQ